MLKMHKDETEIERDERKTRNKRHLNAVLNGVAAGLVLSTIAYLCYELGASRGRLEILEPLAEEAVKQLQEMVTTE